MNIFWMWFSTTIVSFILSYKQTFKMFKYFADAGYKLSINNKSSRLNNDGDLDISNYNSSLLTLFIPFYNIFSVIERELLYERDKEMILEQMIMLGLVEEMNDEEKRIYSEKPSGMNALLIACKKYDKPSDNTQLDIKSKNNGEYLIKIIVHEDKLQTNIIKAKIKNGNDKITFNILDVDGPAKEFNPVELIEYLSEVMDKIRLDENIKYTSDNEYVEITLTKTKPKTKLERYIELRDFLKQNGYLYGEEMCEYHDLEKELGPVLTRKK